MQNYLKLEENEDLEKIKEPAKIIKNGGIVVFPTETVYGIGVNGLDKQAIEKLYKIKKRPIDKPISLLVSDMQMIEYLAKDISDIEYKTYDEFKKYLNGYLEQFIEKCDEYYQNEIAKMEILVEKIKNFEQNLKRQMETKIEKEKILFNLIDKIYENNYKNLKIFNEEYDKEEKHGYRFYKQLSKIKFNFGEFGTEYQEEIIPEIENILNEFEKNLSNKKFKTNIKYPYFELIKRFSQINDLKQESIISCLSENRNNNEIFVGYRDYSINVLVPKNSSYEISQTLKYHKGEITSLLYLDNYLISGSKDRTIKIWQKDADNNYKAKQTINYSEIRCHGPECKKSLGNDKSDFYKCLDCSKLAKMSKYYCQKCKSDHNKEQKHKFIKYDEKHYYCDEHLEPFEKSCLTCKKDLCKYLNSR